MSLSVWAYVYVSVYREMDQEKDLCYIPITVMIKTSSKLQCHFWRSTSLYIPAQILTQRFANAICLKAMSIIAKINPLTIPIFIPGKKKNDG